MCGITGYYSKSKINSKFIIKKMSSTISHRGPDSNGFWEDSEFGISLGHERLSIIDLSIFGHQPMLSSSKQFVITYNGEIYNHLELRCELNSNKSNINWAGNSDTETLLEAIDFWGIEVALNKIQGMFAFAIWDKKNRILSLARDRMGEKPLYFGWQGKGKKKVFLFGSELKALKAHPDFESEINRNAIALQMYYSNIPAPHTIYKNIFKLLPGNYLQLKESDFQLETLPKSKSYWSYENIATAGIGNQLPLNIQKTKDDLEDLLKNSIRKQMLSDLPVGAFLSGGIDSSTIVALMQSQSSKPVKTFTIGFNESNYNEAGYAKDVAKYLRTDHTEIYVSDKQAMEIIPKLSSIYDEPFSDSSQIPTFLVSQLAKSKVAVSLSGDGGDELFGGYNRYVLSKNWWSKISYIPLPIRKFLANKIYSIPPSFWKKIQKIITNSKFRGNLSDLIYKFSKVLKCKSIDDAYLNLISSFDKPTEVVLKSDFEIPTISNHITELNMFDDQQKMMIFDALLYLPNDILVKVDRAAMATSLETRTPFLDHKIVEYSWRIPQELKFKDGQGKWILRQILHKYVPKKLIERSKVGFGIPIDIWLRGALKDWGEDLLNEKRLKNEGYFDVKKIRKKWEEHKSGKRNWQNHLWNILIFQSWLEKYNKKY